MFIYSIQVAPCCETSCFCSLINYSVISSTKEFIRITEILLYFFKLYKKLFLLLKAWAWSSASLREIPHRVADNTSAHYPYQLITITKDAVHILLSEVPLTACLHRAPPQERTIDSGSEGLTFSGRIHVYATFLRLTSSICPVLSWRIIRSVSVWHKSAFRFNKGHMKMRQTPSNCCVIMYPNQMSQKEVMVLHRLWHVFHCWHCEKPCGRSNRSTVHPLRKFIPIKDSFSKVTQRWCSVVTPWWVRVGYTQWQTHKSGQLRFVHSKSHCLKQRRYQIIVTFNSVEHYTLQDYFL